MQSAEGFAATLEHWLAAAVERQSALAWAELRQGVRALSARYVERRADGGAPPDALGSAGKRAAFATYYAALHALTAWRVAADRAEALADVRRVLDLGAGTGATGAAVACALSRRPDVTALERSGWALGEARRTYAAFGVRAKLRRVALPAGCPPLGPGDLALAGWFLNECGKEAREAVLAALERGVRAGARLLVLEPLSSRVTPWWDAFASRFAPHGVRCELVRFDAALPEWIAKMDVAAGLDHAELGARVAWGPA
jgi:predicted nicotinamide N-methyase